MSERTPTPLPAALRWLGARPPTLVPFGVTLKDDADSWLIVPEGTDLEGVARALPDPGTVVSGALVVVMPSAAASGLRALFSAPKTSTRSTRAAALLARGYVSLGACVDPHTKLDLVWGRSP